MPRKLSLDLVPERDWPEADRAAWYAALRPGDPLDEPGRLAGRDADQILKLIAAYGRWLGFLSERGIDWHSAHGIDYFTRENVAPFVARLSADLAPCTVRAYLTELTTVAQALAPDREFDVLKGATRHIWRTAKPVADKRGRLVSSRDLYDLGLDLMHGAEARSTALQTAGTFRDGLMITLLAARPMRRRNLASIEIDRQLTREGDLYWLSFPAEEIKTGRAIEFPLPRALTGPMEQYLTRYRPFLAARTGRWKNEPGKALWISSDGSRLKGGRMHRGICERTQERFGRPINPHLFRDAAATSIAIEDPEHVGIVVAILGHSTIKTSERYYNQATGIDAVRRYQNVIAAYR
jgi:integrase